VLWIRIRIDLGRLKAGTGTGTYCFEYWMLSYDGWRLLCCLDVLHGGLGLNFWPSYDFLWNFLFLVSKSLDLFCPNTNLMDPVRSETSADPQHFCLIKDSDRRWPYIFILNYIRGVRTGTDNFPTFNTIGDGDGTFPENSIFV
jgi:hypothetical protein